MATVVLVTLEMRADVWEVTSLKPQNGRIMGGWMRKQLDVLQRLPGVNACSCVNVNLCVAMHASFPEIQQTARLH